MDEEDGRPGPGARQFGPDDVLTDALVSSLCRPSSFLTKMPRADCISAPRSVRSIPQGLRPKVLFGFCGTAEAVPFQDLIYATSSSLETLFTAKRGKGKTSHRQGEAE